MRVKRMEETVEKRREKRERGVERQKKNDENRASIAR